MYALLVGCRELLKLGGLLAIIEGDSFSAIQWGLRKTSYPWKLADWVKAAHDISSQLSASFRHILWEANDTPMVLLKRECFAILFLLVFDNVRLFCCFRCLVVFLLLPVCLFFSWTELFQSGSFWCKKIYCYKKIKKNNIYNEIEGLKRSMKSSIWLPFYGFVFQIFSFVVLVLFKYFLGLRY